MNSLIQAIRLARVFQAWDIETTAVNEVTLEIGIGEYIVLAGPSGCGKSTLLGLLGLMDTPTRGELFIEGVNVNKLNDHELSKIRSVTCGFIFQAFHLIPYLTVRQNIELPLYYHRDWTKEYRASCVEQACADVGMNHRLDHYPDQLSGGQQQRIAIARAIAGKPKLLLVDEPTGNLDQANSEQVMHLLRDINRQGTAICLVTHDARYQNEGQRTVTMNDGKLINEIRNAATQ